MNNYVQKAKKNDGKSSIKLVVAIVVIAVVAVLGIRYALDFIKKENVKDVQADLLLVRAKIEILKGNNGMNKDENPLLGYQLNQLPEGIDLKTFLDKKVIDENEYEKYYLLDSRMFGKAWIKWFSK